MLRFFKKLACCGCQGSDNHDCNHVEHCEFCKLNYQRKKVKHVVSAKIRNEVWLTYNGDRDIGLCYVCGVQIQRYHAGWHNSHVIPAKDKRSTDTVANLRPCCPGCNLSMGTKNLYVFIRDNNLCGPGSQHYQAYFREHPDLL